MPNVPRLNTPAKVLANSASLRSIIMENGHTCSIMQCMMLDQVEIETTPDMIDEAFDSGIRYFKAYFVGTTTGATGHNAAGVSDIKRMKNGIWKIEERGGILLLHLELPPPTYFQDRERLAIPILEWLVATFPTLKIVCEHITSAELLRVILAMPPHVTANLTSHHLYDTLDIVNGGMLNPHAYCKPPHPTPTNLTTLQLAAVSGNKKIRWGSDTAPHDQGKKECAEGCAGCFTAPHALLMLAEVFEQLLPEELVQQRLQEFVSNRAIEYYGLEGTGKKVLLIRKPTIVRDVYRGDGVSVVPYRAGHTYKWSMEV